MTTDNTFDTFTPSELDMLGNYVSNPSGDVFVLTGVPTGMPGATFARYSRTQGSWRRTFLDEFAKTGELDTRKADALIARVLIAYGDDSVGELEGAHLSCENISNLATKAIEDSRIGCGFIEQSSRYVVYNQKDQQGRYRFLQDPSKNPIMTSKQAESYLKGMNRVFDIYCNLVEKVKGKLEGIKPLTEAEYTIHEGGKPVKIGELTDEKEIRAFKRTYETDLSTKACDTVRILLPAATLTNVGIFANGRAYQHMLNRLYSSEMPEFHELAKSSHAELDKVIKRYVQRAGRNEFVVNTDKAMQALAEDLLHGIAPAPAPDVTLLDDETERIVANYLPGSLFEKGQITRLRRKEFMKNMVATMLYKYAEHPMEQLRDIVSDMTPAQMQNVIEIYTGDRKSKRDRSGRALEYGYPFTYDLCCDFGIFRDLHRHRMLTMERQRLSTRNGFCDIPPLLQEVGADGVKECQDISADLYEKVRAECGRDVAQYPVLFGFNIRFYQGMNAREAQHLCELRTIKQGHPSYRKVAQKMRTMAVARHPWLEKATKFTDYNDYFWSRAESEARQRQKEAELDKNEQQDG